MEGSVETAGNVRRFAGVAISILRPNHFSGPAGIYDTFSLQSTEACHLTDGIPGWLIL
jgi:hypothetical protein